MVDVAALCPLPRFVPLTKLRALPELSECAPFKKRSRLSVLPLSRTEFEAVLSAGGLHSLDIP